MHTFLFRYAHWLATLLSSTTHTHTLKTNTHKLINVYTHMHTHTHGFTQANTLIFTHAHTHTNTRTHSNSHQRTYGSTAAGYAELCPAISDCRTSTRPQLPLSSCWEGACRGCRGVTCVDTHRQHRDTIYVHICMRVCVCKYGCGFVGMCSCECKCVCTFCFSHITPIRSKFKK